MGLKVSIIHFIIFFIQIQYVFPTYEESNDRCLNRIYRDCTHEYDFTEEKLENVRLYLKKRFGKTRPIRKPCERIRVRKDIKCLSKQEFQDFVDVIHRLHKNGFLDKMTEIHDKSWSAVHKYGVGLPWHRWFLNIFEEEMLKINPKVTLPYWNFFDEFAEPHKSIVWELFGHSGTPETDYCVVDGPFANMTFSHPTPSCLRRQWKADRTMNPWEGPEWVTATSQMGIDFPLLVKELHLLANWSTIMSIPRNIKEAFSMLKTLDATTKPWSQFALGMAFVAHFKTHLSIGGLAGDMSRSFAPNDPLFYVFHAVSSDMIVLNWQLADDRHLVPADYGLGIDYDFERQISVPANIETDTLPLFSHIKDKEAFQMGYGELCYIQDIFVEPINEIMRGERRPLPEAYHRLKAALPADIFGLYYPKFHYYPQKVTFFDYLLTDVPKECNKKCVPTPLALDYLDSPEGIRVWHRFKNDLGMDLTLTIAELEKSYHKFMDYLNQYKYCSPYVL